MLVRSGPLESGAWKEEGAEEVDEILVQLY
jgi:hypothetical protein